MTRREIAACLDRSVRGQPWHGYSLQTLLADVTADEAVSHPIAGGHSIAELLAHLAAWMEEVGAWITGAERTITTPSLDWPEPAAWPGPLDALGKAHDLLLARVRSTAESRLSEIVHQAETPGLTFEAVLVGIAEHNAYHGGQIPLLKRAARATREKRER